jgi:opacity protein-like surface antigen
MKALLALTQSLAFLASPALADDLVTFQSPTGNIHCNIYEWQGDTGARCDLRELTPTYTYQPEGCDYDWGQSFGVDRRGKGYLACVSDALFDPGNPVLPYGEAVSLGGISCVSAKTGMTCTNAEGHGFSVAKSKQRLF